MKRLPLVFTAILAALPLALPASNVGRKYQSEKTSYIDPVTGLQVIVLTSYHEDEQIFPAIRAGALSYLLKGVGLDELTEAVRKAARGEATLHPHVAARLVQEIHGSSQETTSLYKTLSEREREVLRLIAEGFSNALIAEKLVISERTVKSHVNNILSKLHVADRTQAAIFAWRQGIMDI